MSSRATLCSQTSSCLASTHCPSISEVACRVLSVGPGGCGSGGRFSALRQSRSSCLKSAYERITVRSLKEME